ncbi:conserved hypothetical protein [Leishmania major strain Friedlin]|uniref:Uncharacterized protein n=1 Tax=Leishmania major TaxID=5664 RepID=Q4QIL7_LEIMA|nr:conserved hypothetical protein [Leishmania major strain Friedlin]CAG9569013.1 hypothetical_protein_-_conserved [Leishmania major strain Friedlin]CAJ07036.1 conserved hypothetical protein [Leishmania major strain Friedlin]|eukprot:XP_001680981.1 conserved hypothetical protein [Leishmania major strain Friedlin]
MRLHDVATASVSGRQSGQQDAPARPSAAGAALAVTPLARSLPSPRSRCATSATPPLPLPPPLVRPAKKAVAVGGHGCSTNGVVGGALLFRDWSTNAALLDEVLNTPFFQLLPKSTENTVAPSAAAHDPALQSVTLPTSDTPLPSILLIALADIEVLQQSFCAHTLVNPVKNQLSEFKRLVAASMRSELTHRHEPPHTENLAAEAQPAAAVAEDVHAGHNAVDGEGEKTAGAAMHDDDSADDSALIVSSLQAHDAAVRAALRTAHGFLYGSETVPVGVPVVHLERARREWLTRYRIMHVQPHLQKAQRRRYEAWAQQHPQIQGFTDGSADDAAHQHGASASQSAMTPVSMCAALQPTYWRTITMERPSAGLTTTHPGTANMPPAEVGEAAGGSSVVPPPTRRLWSSSSAHSASPLHALSPAKTTAVPVLYKAAWDVDLYDDLGLAVSAEQLDIMVRQATSRTAVEAMELEELASQFSTTAANASFASPTEPSAPPPLIRAADLTQMQLTLPVFVYVVSRYLFVAHYAAYFPTGLFSRALIDPFYFPDAAQCAPEYALRAAPALRREMRRVYASYAAKLADAHRCFPDRTRSTEVPLPPNDMFHLWELLCPPQRQDVAGRWNPIPWGQLMPEEEEALLDEEFKSVAHAGQDAVDKHVSHEEPLLSYPYARAARLTYRQRLQQLAQHPLLLAEVHRLLSQCEDVAMQFFTMIDMEQKGCITWEAFTNALIEEADVQDHQRKVRERAAHLTRTSASVFDRYVVEPLPSTLARLGYTGNVLEVRHSASLVMLEGANDYAVCDGTQLGSIHQRFLVRPMEVLCKELEEEPHDAFGRLIRGLRGDRGGGGGDGEIYRRRAHSNTDADGYDAALRQRPWRNNQQPLRVYVRYEDGRRLQESTALNMLQQLSPSKARAVTAAGRGTVDDHEGAFTSMRAHQPAKLVSLEGILVVENVSPCVPYPVFVTRGNDMLLRLYGASRAVQALPEAGVLRCTKTVSSMEWAAGGRRARRSSVSSTGTTSNSAASRSAGVHGDGRELQGRRSGNPAQGDRTLSPAVAPLSPHQRTHHDRISVQREEYLLLGTRDGTILLVDLYALLNHVPRLAMPADTHSGSTVEGVSNSAAGDGTGDVGGNGGAASTMGAAFSVMQSTSERIGSSESAWSGYRDLARRTYYGDIGAFVVHTRQVHTPGTLVSSVVAAATNGLVVSSGLDGDVFTMRLAYPFSWITAAGTQRTPSGVAAGVGPATADTSRPLVCIEVLHRMRVSDTGVRYALPIPFLSMLAVQTASNKVYLYHTSVLPTASALVDGGRSDAASTQVSPAPLSTPRAVPEGVEVAADGGFSLVPAASSATSPRLELYDAAAPHLGSIVAMILVKELDQLITVDSSGYVKVWSLRQTQPLTSFYAWAPLNIPNSGSGVGDAGRLTGWSSSQGSGAAHRGNGHGSSMSAGGVPTSSSALLRTTKNSIEVAVDAAEYRLQPCRSAAFNYTGRQLFVMGSHNAAHCFFVSGQSSSRAHTQPLRVLLVDTATVSRVGGVNHRLISLSSADCRVWSLLTGTMELGIRANSAEYRHLFNNRLTGNVRGRSSSIAKSVEQQRLSRKGGRGCRSRGARPRSSYRTRTYNAHDALVLAAASSSTTTGEPQRLLPPSVDDVMRAVLARPWSTHSYSRHHDAPWRAAGAAAGPRREAAVAAATASLPLLTAGKQPHGSAEAPGNSGGTGGGAEDDTDELVTNVMRDQNLLLSDIRCACLGPGGEWVGYALLHGDVRLHRSDSGRLLHTFITTPPSTEDLIEAAMQYQHLFTPVTAAYALPPLHPVTVGDAAAAASNMPAGMNTAYGGGGGASGSLTTVVPPSQSPTARLPPIAYAKAVALVLERLLATTIGVTCGPTGAAPASAPSADGDDRLGRNVHREPLHMLYLDASQELLVAYADGLLRSFTLLSHSSTATRVIVSRTLMNRALTQVRHALAWNSRHAGAARPATAAGTEVPGRRSASLNASLSVLPPKELLTAGSLRGVGIGDAEAIEDHNSLVATDRNSVPPSRVACSEGAGGGPTVRLNNADAAEVMPAASPANIARAVMVSLSTRQIEPDVVLLATASSPLGLICLVHASGLVTVLDVQSRSETDGAARMRMMLSDADDVKGGVGGGCAEQKPESGRGRAEAGVVVHSFMTTDEVTAAMFLGAYPCLVLADRQHQLSFHLMKGSSLLALLGEFAEQLEKDVMACAAGLREQAEPEASVSATAKLSLTALRSTSSYTAAASSPRLPPTGRVETGAERGSNPTATSSTLVWTFSVADTCASQRSLGYITALTFDALYATVYVGTSQGYIVSYLVRRFVMAFQLTPVFLRGVDGVAVSTYAAELQRALAAARPGASPCNNPSRDFLHNYLRVVFDVPPSVATQATETRLRSPRKRHVSLTGNPSTAATPASQSPKELGGLIDVYKCRRDLFHVSWRGVTGKRRGGGGSGMYAAAPSQAISICTSSEALIAAAVLHDAVTRMTTVASACGTAAEACPGTTATPDETQPWWCTPAGRTVKEYVTRKCRGDAARGGMGESTGAANASPADLGELELGAEGVQLLRGWVAAVLAEQRRYLPRNTSDAEAVSEARQQRQQESFSTTPVGTQGGVSRTSSSRSRSSSGLTAVPPVLTSACGHDVFTSGVSHAGADQGAAADAVGGGAATAASQTATAQQLAEALVQEVQEELLFGKEAPATVAAAHYGYGPMSELTTPAATPQHPITDSWVELLFTRQAMCTTSRSPLCLLTPPAMLERARRERQDRRGRMAATAAAAAGNAAGDAPAIPEWNAYVEGALPDYLADILSHPSQVLTEVERQALQQRSITVLQCRRNGYLCVGHADGGVTLWTPYACARLESLCPSTSLAATLDRLAASVKTQFHCLHERILLERQRLAFEGSLRNSRHTEEERVACMKRRIRAMLLEHHLAQLQLERTEGEGEGDADALAGRAQETEPPSMFSTSAKSALNPRKRSTPNARRHSSRAAVAKAQGLEKCSTSTQPFVCGSMEAELLAMRPLLCLLLGVSSPAELRARQLSLEDLFFLPFKARNLASLEAFNPHSYDVAVAVAMRRLRRDLIEEAEEYATEEPGGNPQLLPDALTAAVTQAVSTASHTVTSPASPVSLSGSAGHLQRKRQESVYDYRLSSLARAWHDGADRPQKGQSSDASGAATFPGVLRLLLHRAMERAPYLSNGAVAATSPLTAASAAAPVNAGKMEIAHGTAAHAAGAQSPSPTPAAIADGTAPADGEYYEVCHVLQVAEVQAESKWEVEELGRAWRRLQASTVAATAFSTTARWNSGRDRADVCDSPPAQLPLSSAAAVSAAVDRQVKRGLEARIVALSHRAVAAALLRNVQLCCRSAHTRAALVPPPLHPGDGASGAYSAWPPTTSRRGGGLAWVQSVLRQQVQQAFTEPLLTWLQLASSSVSHAVIPIRYGSTWIYGQQRSPALAATAMPVLSGEEGLLPSPTNAPLQALCHTSSTPGGGGGDGDPHAAPAEGCRENKKAFLTEVPGDANGAGAAVGSSLCPPERVGFGASGHTAVTGGTDRRAGQRSLSSRLSSTADRPSLGDVGMALSSKDSRSPLPSPLPPLKSTRASTISGHRLGSLGVHDARAMIADRGNRAASAMGDTASLISRSLSSTSSLSMTSIPPNATLSSPAVYPTPQVRQRLLTSSALHRTKLAHTGSCGGAPHQQRPVTTGVTGRGGAAGNYTVVTNTLHAAAARTTVPPATSTGYGGGRRGGAGGGGGTRGSRAAAVQPFTYYSLFGQAGTTK